MTFSNTKAPPPVTLDSLRSAIKKVEQLGDDSLQRLKDTGILPPHATSLPRAIYVRSDAWPALRRELEARCLVHDTRTSAGRTIPTGRVAGLLGIDIFVTEMPIPKPWAWDFELGIKP